MVSSKGRKEPEESNSPVLRHQQQNIIRPQPLPEQVTSSDELAGKEVPRKSVLLDGLDMTGEDF